MNNLISNKIDQLKYDLINQIEGTLVTFAEENEEEFIKEPSIPELPILPAETIKETQLYKMYLEIYQKAQEHAGKDMPVKVNIQTEVIEKMVIDHVAQEINRSFLQIKSYMGSNSPLKWADRSHFKPVQITEEGMRDRKVLRQYDIGFLDALKARDNKNKSVVKIVYKPGEEPRQMKNNTIAVYEEMMAQMPQEIKELSTYLVEGLLGYGLNKMDIQYFFDCPDDQYSQIISKEGEFTEDQLRKAHAKADIDRGDTSLIDIVKVREIKRPSDRVIPQAPCEYPHVVDHIDDLPQELVYEDMTSEEVAYVISEFIRKAISWSNLVKPVVEQK